MIDYLSRRVAVVGLGYVGLPVAVAFAERYLGTVGFDINNERVSELSRGIDRTREVDDTRLRKSNLVLTTDPNSLASADFFIVTVPTPIDRQRRPDLSALRLASQMIGAAMRPGAVIVYESTVYPGVTESICGPILEKVSGLGSGTDFTLAYSPERINPGDSEHRFETIPKVVSAQDEETLELVADVYGSVVDSEIHRAPTIAVAEAAKVIENAQRDLNIALVNELAIIFDKLGIDTHAVLEAAATKWNFNRFTPGLVGGHCIGVDPYYLTARAEEVGIHPTVILAGRRINDGMGRFVAEATVKNLVKHGVNMNGCRVLVAGVSFKENVPDVRNTGVVSIIESLKEYGLDPTVWDPMCDADDVVQQVGIRLAEPGDPSRYDAIILAVPHDEIVDSVATWVRRHHTPVLIDVKGRIDPTSLPSDLSYWRL